MRFPTQSSFQRVLPLLNITVASLHPLTDQQVNTPWRVCVCTCGNICHRHETTTIFRAGWLLGKESLFLFLAAAFNLQWSEQLKLRKIGECFRVIVEFKTNKNGQTERQEPENVQYFYSSPYWPFLMLYTVAALHPPCLLFHLSPPPVVWGRKCRHSGQRITSLGRVYAPPGAAVSFSIAEKWWQQDAQPLLFQGVVDVERGRPGWQVSLWPQVHDSLLEKNKEENAGKREEGIIRVFVLFFSLQEWPYSHSILALQAGRKTKPTADVGAGTSHPEGSHLQG